MKLIVDTKNAPMRKVNAILATWAYLAELVDDQVTPARGCQLEWDLVLQHVSRATGWSVEEGVDYWEAYGAVRMVFPARVEGVDAGLEKQVVNVPLTEVREIMIYDDQTVSWHGSEKVRPEKETSIVFHLAAAVSKGKLLTNSGWHHYRKNWIPIVSE